MIDPNGYLAEFILGNNNTDNNTTVDAVISAAPRIPSGYNPNPNSNPVNINLTDPLNTTLDELVKRTSKIPRKMSMSEAIRSLPNRSAKRVYIRGLAQDVLNMELPVPGAKISSVIQKISIVSPILFIPTAVNDFRNNKVRKAWIALGIDTIAMATGIAIAFPGGIPGAIAQTYITSQVTKKLKEWTNVK